MTAHRDDGRGRVLVTGGSGFVGCHVVPALARADYDVHVVARRPGVPGDGVTWHAGDLLADGTAERVVDAVQPSHLVHLAWCATPGIYWTSPENVEWVRASLALIRAFASRGGRRLLVAGTAAEYDWRYGFCVEHLTPLAPSSVYGAAKHALNVVMEAYAAEVGLSAAWARLFFLFGPFEHPARLVPSVVNGLRSGRAVPCTTGTQVRDFLHVEDAADALLHVMESDLVGPVNIGSGEPITVKEIVDRIARQMGRPELVQFGTLPTEDARPCVLASTVRLRSEVAWAPRRPLHKRLNETVQWWLEQRQTA